MQALTLGAGNWNVQLNDGTGAGIFLQFGGQLQTANSQVAAKLTTIPVPLGQNGPTYFNCYPLLQAVSFSGGIDAQGHLNLVSQAIANEVITLSGVVPAANATDFVGEYTVKAGDPSQSSCNAGLQGSFVANLIPPVTGTFAGTMTPESGTPVPATLSLTTSASPDSTGAYHLTGTLSTPGWACMSGVTIETQGDFTGDPSSFLGGDFMILYFGATNSSAPQAGANIFVNNKADSINFVLYEMYGGPCANQSATATFSKQ